MNLMPQSLAVDQSKVDVVSPGMTITGEQPVLLVRRRISTSGNPFQCHHSRKVISLMIRKEIEIHLALPVQRITYQSVTKTVQSHCPEQLTGFLPFHPFSSEWLAGIHQNSSGLLDFLHIPLYICTGGMKKMTEGKS